MSPRFCSYSMSWGSHFFHFQVDPPYVSIEEYMNVVDGGKYELAVTLRKLQGDWHEYPTDSD